MTNKIFCCLIAVLLIGQQFFGLPVFALADTDNAADESSKTSIQRFAPASLTGNDADRSEVLTLNFLRDTALSLQQIQQQAINIFLEVTRKDVQPHDTPVVVYPKSISDKELQKNCVYLKPRAVWLYYYVGTMEPIIHLFATDVKDTKAGVTRVFVPKAVKTEMSPLWHAWGRDIKELNEHLTAIYELANNENPDNIAIGEHAVAMYNIGNSLESTRIKTVDKIRKLEKRGIQSETVGIQ